MFPVHGSAGILGTLLYSFVAVDSWSGLSPNVGFMFEGLLAQAVGVFVIAGWTITATALVWYALKLAGQARVSPEHENEGLDVSEHGVESYPEFGDEGAAVADGGRQPDGGFVRSARETADGTMTDGHEGHADDTSGGIQDD